MEVLERIANHELKKVFDIQLHNILQYYPTYFFQQLRPKQ